MAAESPASGCVNCGAEPGTRSSGTIPYSARSGEDWTGSGGALRAHGEPPILPAGDDWEFCACRFTSTNVRRAVRNSKSWSARTLPPTRWPAQSADIGKSNASRASFPPMPHRRSVQRRPAAAAGAAPTALVRWPEADHDKPRDTQDSDRPVADRNSLFAIRHSTLERQQCPHPPPTPPYDRSRPAC